MNLKLLLFSFFIAFSFVSNGQKINVYTIGDSTMANKKESVFPETGWGQVLYQFFDNQVMVHNHAVNGRSSKSFLSEGRWKSVLDSLQKGDYVFIQFGHNDQKVKSPDRYTKPFGEYSDNLRKYVIETREKGATPILFTSIVRRKFDEKGKLVDTHGDYLVAVRKVAKEMGVELIDMQKMTEKVVKTLGDPKSKELYLWTEPNEQFPKGRQDNTHLCTNGARCYAGMVAVALKKLPLDLARHVVDSKPVVGLDNWFNHETHKKTGKRYHYIWSDTENSGFSQLGDLFVEDGAKIETIDAKPRISVLRSLDVYMIVDPDTTSENLSPNYIMPEDIQAVESWVKDGGTLVLMANDGPNCEFTHFNQLARVFGFHFVPVTLNPVLNHDWEMGAEVNLPKHPLFKGVQKIYMKEVAPIKLSGDAKAVLVDEGNIYIAETNYGKGRVLAIGDPWLYNEYIGNSRLPDSFENTKAARNMVSYLLEK